MIEVAEVKAVVTAGDGTGVVEMVVAVTAVGVRVEVMRAEVRVVVG